MPSSTSIQNVDYANVYPFRAAVIEQLEAERERAHKELARIDSALVALGSTTKRTVTAASRRRMAVAQRARWAKAKR